MLERAGAQDIEIGIPADRAAPGIHHERNVRRTPRKRAVTTRATGNHWPMTPIGDAQSHVAPVLSPEANQELACGVWLSRGRLLSLTTIWSSSSHASCLI